jgi:hypothetical protein
VTRTSANRVAAIVVVAISAIDKATMKRVFIAQ